MKKTPLKIGNIELKTPFLLAPLAGITDVSMRLLCMKQGASLVFTEMVSAKGLWYGDKKTGRLLKTGAEERNTGFQLFGRDPEIMGFAADALKEEKNIILDLNAGCPVPKIVKNGEGSALLKEPEQLYDVVRAMVEKAGKPVTVKIRKGFYRGENTAVEAARAAEAAGASAVTVHGRTREQYYEGRADWDAVAQVKRALKIPVIGNGDVKSGRDAVRMMEETGCDGVMIARGALGNPWIFAESAALWEERTPPPPPSDEERIETLLKHLDLIEENKGEYIAVREIRKHTGWYTKGMKGSAALRRQVNSITDIDLMREIIKSFSGSMGSRRD